MEDNINSIHELTSKLSDVIHNEIQDFKLKKKLKVIEQSIIMYTHWMEYVVREYENTLYFIKEGLVPLQEIKDTAIESLKEGKSTKPVLKI